MWPWVACSLRARLPPDLSRPHRENPGPRRFFPGIGHSCHIAVTQGLRTGDLTVRPRPASAESGSCRSITPPLPGGRRQPIPAVGKKKPCGAARLPARMATAGARRRRIDAAWTLPYKPAEPSVGSSREGGIFPEKSRAAVLATFDRSACAATSGELTREADLSTEQIGAQASPRLSGAHGDEGRSPGAQRPSCAWPEATERLTGRATARSFSWSD